MLTLIKILVVVYIIAINVYSFMLIYTARKNDMQEDFDNDKKIRDSSLFVSALLGGATAIYVAMFVFKYRLRSLFLMILMPILIVINAYILIMAFWNNFGFIIDNTIFRNLPYLIL